MWLVVMSNGIPMREVSGLIVDITADQFPDCTSSVIVTSDDAWHQRFEESCRRPAGFLNGLSSGIAFQASNSRNLNIVYRTALTHL